MSLMDASLEPGYDLIVQEPWCCIPACVQMMLLRRGLPSGSQEDIGNELGLVVPPDYADCFDNVRSEPEPPAGHTGYGTRIDEPEYNLESYFARNDLPLACEFHPPSDIGNISRFLQGHLQAGDDILVCFRYRHLYGVEEAGDNGHGSLIQQLKGDSLVLADPHGCYPKVSLDRFFEAVQVHKAGGFWVVSSLEECCSTPRG